MLPSAVPAATAVDWRCGFSFALSFVRPLSFTLALSFPFSLFLFQGTLGCVVPLLVTEEALNIGKGIELLLGLRGFLLLRGIVDCICPLRGVFVQINVALPRAASPSNR